MAAPATLDIPRAGGSRHSLQPLEHGEAGSCDWAWPGATGMGRDGFLEPVQVCLMSAEGGSTWLVQLMLFMALIAPCAAGGEGNSEAAVRGAGLRVMMVTSRRQHEWLRCVSDLLGFTGVL